MNSMDILIWHFKDKEGEWLNVGDNGERVMFRNSETGVHNSSLTLYFVYAFETVKIHIAKVFESDIYADNDVYMRVYIPEGLHEFRVLQFDNAKKLEFLLNEILCTWMKGVERIYGTGLIWED